MCLSRRNKEKVTKTMTYNKKINMIASAEIGEFFVPDPVNGGYVETEREIRRLCGPEITSFALVKRDATPNNGKQLFEVNMPPMVINDFAREKYKLVEDKLVELNAKVNKNCGCHVHVSTRKLLDSVDANTFNELSWNKFFSNKAEVLAMLDYTTQMPLLAMKDIGLRYYDHMSEIELTLSPSRSGNYYAKKLANYKTKINSASTIENLGYVGNTKFHAVNYHPLRSDKETIEFRQRDGTFVANKIFDWFEFLLNMIDHTLNKRVRLSSSTSTTETISRPDANDIFRRGTVKNVIYSLISRTGGATTREIMSVMSGQSTENVRRAICEIRARLGAQSVTTHTSQYYGHNYGSSQGIYNLGGYSAPNEWTVTSTSAEPTEMYLPSSIIGAENVFCGLDYDVYNRLTSRFI
ncbi:MAG: amidoligase family protein [Patiriisocius sp.]